MIRFISPLLFCAVLLSSLPARAQEVSEEPIEADRPGFAEGTGTVAPGRFQIEAGYTFTRRESLRAHGLGEALLRLPAGPRSELRIELPSYVWSRESGQRDSGFEDAGIGFKIRLADKAEKSPGPAISLLAATTLPTGSGGMGAGTLQPSLTLIAGWDLTEKVGLSLNAQYAYLSEEGEHFSQFAPSLELELALTERLGTYLEAFSLFSSFGGGPDAHYLGTGLTYLTDNNTQIDINGGVGLNSARPDYFIGAGIARRW